MPLLSLSALIRLVVENGETQKEVDAFIAKVTAIRDALGSVELVDHTTRTDNLAPIGNFSLLRLTGLAEHPLMRLSVDWRQIDPAADSYVTRYVKIITPMGIITDEIATFDPDIFDPADPLPWLARRIDLWLRAAIRPIAKSALEDWPWLTPDPAYAKLAHAINIMMIADGLRDPADKYFYCGPPHYEGYLQTRPHWSKMPTLITPVASYLLASMFFPTISMKTINNGEHRLSATNIPIRHATSISSFRVMKDLASFPHCDGPYFIPVDQLRSAA